MAKAPKFELKCEKCGRPQPKDEKRSNKNFDVFNNNEKCECGGNFVMFIDFLYFVYSKLLSARTK